MSWPTEPEGPGYDWDFITGQEKGIKAGQEYGYWPGFDDSGMTLGEGVDISRQLMKELSGANLSEKALKLLEPYTAPKPGKYGPTGSQIATRGNDLDIYTRDEKGDSTGRRISLGDDDLSKLNTYAREKSVASAESNYNLMITDDNGPYPHATAWKDLSNAQRTVMVDLAHNAGGSFVSKTTDLKGYVQAGDWDMVAAELADEDGKSGWHEEDLPRHKRRAALLLEEEYK